MYPGNPSHTDDTLCEGSSTNSKTARKTVVLISTGFDYISVLPNNTLGFSSNITMHRGTDESSHELTIVDVWRRADVSS